MTLKLRPRAFYSWDFDVLSGDRQIAFLDRHWIRERATFSLEGATYAIRRTSVLRSSFVFEKDGRVIAQATKPSRLRREFEIQAGPERWILRAVSMFRREFELVRGGLRIGTMKPDSAFRRAATADFPDLVPLPLQVFVACLVLVLWKRDADRAAASG